MGWWGDWLDQIGRGLGRLVEQLGLFAGRDIEWMFLLQQWYLQFFLLLHRSHPIIPLGLRLIKSLINPHLSPSLLPHLYLRLYLLPLNLALNLHFIFFLSHNGMRPAPDNLPHDPAGELAEQGEPG